MRKTVKDRIARNAGWFGRSKPPEEPKPTETQEEGGIFHQKDHYSDDDRPDGGALLTMDGHTIKPQDLLWDGDVLVRVMDSANAWDNRLGVQDVEGRKGLYLTYPTKSLSKVNSDGINADDAFKRSRVSSRFLSYRSSKRKGEFSLIRKEDETGNSGTGRVAQGFVFEDGTVTMRWLTDTRSTAFYNNIDELESIHGHDGKTVVSFKVGQDAE